MSNLTTTARRFSRAIYSAGLTSGQFGRLAGIKPSRVTKIREGAEPTADEIATCCRVCGVSPEWIAGTEPGKPDDLFGERG